MEEVNETIIEEQDEKKMDELTKMEEVNETDLEELNEIEGSNEEIASEKLKSSGSGGISIENPPSGFTFRDLVLSEAGQEIVTFLRKKDKMIYFDFASDYEEDDEEMRFKRTTLLEGEKDKKWLDYPGPDIQILLDAQSDEWSGRDDEPVPKKKEKFYSCIRPSCLRRKVIYPSSELESEEDFIQMPKIHESDRAFIRIYFGPNKVSGIVRHRVHRVLGLRDILREKFGHRVQLIPTIFWNRVEIAVGNYNVFRCNLKFLEISQGMDPVSKRAIEAVKEALERIQPQNTYPKGYILGMENSPVISLYDEILEEILRESLAKLEPRYLVRGVLGTVIAGVMEHIKKEKPMYYEILKILEDLLRRRVNDTFDHFGEVLTMAMEKAIAKVDPNYQTTSYSDCLKMILCATSRALEIRERAQSAIANVMDDLLGKVIPSEETMKISSSTEGTFDDTFEEQEAEPFWTCCIPDYEGETESSIVSEVIYKKPGHKDHSWPKPWYPFRRSVESEEKKVCDKKVQTKTPKESCVEEVACMLHEILLKQQVEETSR